MVFGKGDALFFEKRNETAGFWISQEFSQNRGVPENASGKNHMGFTKIGCFRLGTHRGYGTRGYGVSDSNYHVLSGF